MEFRAQVRFTRVSPQKARLVLNLIKGRKVEDALNILVFTKKRVAATLYVKDAVANDGPRMKRIRPAPMGRAFRYVRRIAHIEIVLAERGKSGESLATVVGEETAAAKTPVRGKAKASAKRKAPAAKKKVGAR